MDLDLEKELLNNPNDYNVPFTNLIDIITIKNGKSQKIWLDPHQSLSFFFLFGNIGYQLCQMIVVI